MSIESPRRIAVLAAAMIAAASPRIAIAGGFVPRYDAYLSGSPWVDYEFFGSDGHGPDCGGGGCTELGFGGAISRRYGRFFDLGLGLRYDFGRGRSDEFGNRGDNVHLVAAPLTIAGVLPIGTGTELRLGAGIGPAFAGFLEGDNVYAFGASTEVALAFSQRLHSSGLGLSLQVGVRLDMLPKNTHTDSQAADGTLVNVQLPFVRAGATWR